MIEDFPIAFDRPWALLLGAMAIAVTLLIAHRSGAGQSRGWLRFTTALRILLLGLISLSLADIRTTWRGRELSVLFLVDVSASMPAGAVTGDGGILDRIGSLGALPAECQAGVILFGANAAVHTQLATVLARHPVETVIDGEASDIAAALRLADATFTYSHAAGAKRVVLISDGNATQGNELLEAKNLAAAGAVVDVLPVEYRHEHEIMIDSVRVPPEAHPEEPYSVAVILHAATASEARLLLFENDVEIAARDVELTPGKTRVEFPILHEEPSRYRYEVRVYPSEREGVVLDSFARNNVGHGFTLIRGSSRVLFIGDESSHRPLLDALASSGIAVDSLAPAAIPSRPESYFLYDTIVLANVPAFDVGTEAMRLLNGVVKNLGLGFIMIGGPDAFGAGGYKRTPIEALLPVDMDVKQRKILPNGALALVLHTCEFPAGNMWAKRIVEAAVETLNPQDYVGVLVWGMLGGDGWGVPFGLAGDRAEIVAQVRDLQPSDMPSFQPTMQLGFDALLDAPAQRKHMVIISDGDPGPPSGGLLQQFASARISVSTVCIFPHGNQDTGTLKKIAQVTGGRYYFVNDPKKLPQIFVREALEVHRSLILEEDFTPVVARTGSDMLRGLDTEAFPTLRGYVVTTPKPLAETLLVSHLDDPILATWRYGLGKTVAFTSDDGGRWAGAWTVWPGFEPFWAQIIRSVARGGTDQIFRVERSIEGDRGKLLLDAIDSEGRYIDGLTVGGRVLSPKLDEEAVSFQQTGPGRYEAEFAARQSGTYLVSLDYKNSGGVEGIAAEGASQTGISVSYTQEFRSLASDTDRLARIAATTGGRVLDWEADFFDRSLPVRRSQHAIWDRLIEILLFLWFVDIFLRRVVVTSAPFRRVWRYLIGRGAAPVVDASAQLVGKLLEARAERRAAVPASSVAPRPEERKPDAPRPPAGVTGRPAPREQADRQPEASGRSAPPATSFTDRLLEAKRRAQDERRRPGGGK